MSFKQGRIAVTLRIVPILLLILFGALARADGERSLFQSTSPNSAYAEVGLALIANRIPIYGFGSDDASRVTNTTYDLGIVLDARFQYKRFFAETVDDSFSTATVGFSLYDNDRGSLELIATSYFLTLERDKFEGLETVEDRHGDVSLGIRSSHFFNNNLLQVELVSDVAAHEGFVGAIHLGHEKLIGNWSFYALAGLRYFSEKVVDHLLGVSANEATDTLPIYQAGSGVLSSLYLGATLPLTEKWVFSARAEYGRFSSEISDSPLVRGDDLYFARVGLNYVLFN